MSNSPASPWSGMRSPRPSNQDEMSSRLTTIYRKVRNDLAEGGTNTLFLAVGFCGGSSNRPMTVPTGPRCCWFR